MDLIKKTRVVYVIEDDIELSTLMDRILKNIDPKISLDWSTSAEEAIQSISSNWKKGIVLPYVLIIIDIFLDGEKSGLDLYKLCIEKYPTIPIILTSSGNLKNILPINLGLSPTLLQKPFTVRKCKQIFKKILS